MMDMQKYKRYGIAGIFGILVFCAGMLVGQNPMRTVEEDTEAVSAFAMATGEEALPTPTLSNPAETLDNWFSIETVEPSPTSSAQVQTTPEASFSPPPEATEEPSFLIELVRDDIDGSSSPEGRAKRVLIYHTHTYEAYEQTETDPYKELQQWRTADERHNIVCVGEELAALLRGMGIEVVHDTTAFEPPDLNSSYTRSLEMLEKRRDSGEIFDLYIDLHRDAYLASQSGTNAVAIGDSSVAKLMLLIGKGEGQTTEGYEEKPEWEDNLAIAQRITDELNSELPGLGKDVRVKSGRFNQHIAIGCVLVEVGNNKNTLAEAKAAMPYLADAIQAALVTDK